MGYANSSIITNADYMSKYAQSGTMEVLLDMPQFMSEMGLSLKNASAAFKTPAQADAFIKNILHNDIYVGGRNSDINFMRRIAGNKVTSVKTKEVSTRYLTKRSNVITFTSTRLDTTNAGYVWATVSPSSHIANGTLSAPAIGYQIRNKKTQRNYVIVDENKTVPFAHEVKIASQDAGIAAGVEANQGYFVSKSQFVGGVSTPTIGNDIPDVGWMQSVRFSSRRIDRQIAIDTLDGWKDTLRFSLMPTSDGKLMWSWLPYQQEEARYQMQLNLSTDLLLATPITNSQLINDNNSITNPYFPKFPNIDSLRIGYYGLEPSIRYGGGMVYPYPKSTGFDFDRDGERIFARQNALRRTTEWLFIAGQMARYALDRVGSLLQQIYKMGISKDLEFADEGGSAQPSWTSDLKKWSINSYNYHGQTINIKTMDALSDIYNIGSDELSHRVYCMPLDGGKHLTTGAPVAPIEIIQYGDNGFSGGYEEYLIDQRKTDARTKTYAFWCQQAQSVLFNDINLWMMLEGFE